METIFRFATGNTRLKDFIDLFGLIQTGLDENSLRLAIDGTFKARRQMKDYNELQRILTNQEFIDFLNLAMARTFSHLQFSAVNEVIDKILEFSEAFLTARK